MMKLKFDKEEFKRFFLEPPFFVLFLLMGIISLIALWKIGLIKENIWFGIVGILLVLLTALLTSIIKIERRER